MRIGPAACAPPVPLTIPAEVMGEATEQAGPLLDESVPEAALVLTVSPANAQLLDALSVKVKCIHVMRQR